MGLARQASRLPLTALSLGLEAWERSSGLRAFALRRGTEAIQIAAHTPLGRLLPKLVLDDGADEEAARLTKAVREDAPAPSATRQTAGSTTAPAPVATFTPPAEPVSEAAKEAGAPGAVTAEVEAIVDDLEVEEPETRAELPIPDFDNITLGSLRARLRSLDLEQLAVLREWEQAHAHRLPVITALDNRIAKLGSTETAAAAAYPTEGATPSRV